MKVSKLPQHVIKSTRIQDKVLDLSVPHVMGILNVTPDSFSDGGTFNSVDRAIEHARTMLTEGASIIDVGGESTRPNAHSVLLEEELSRVIPVINGLRQEFGEQVWISIDTSNAEVMQQAVAAGADIINDVRALKREHALQTAAELNVPVVLMHMRGEPATMNDLAVYNDVVGEVKNELSTRIALALDAGISRENIIIDPGFGFAKEHEHHKHLLNEFHTLQELGFPVLFGVSRKRFIGEILTQSGISVWANNAAQDRDVASAGAALIAVQQGASIVRAHNVAMTTQILSLWHQLS